MKPEGTLTDTDLVEATGQIVAAYVSNNTVPTDQLPNLIKQIRKALIGDETPSEPQANSRTQPSRSEIRKSITPDYLISFEDGRRYKTLKRHLSGHDLSPQQYRAKWGLPDDYPMVAPNYSAVRSQLAKKSGLGVKPGAATKPNRKSK